MADPIIADECIHLMTTAFCTICKKQTREKETRARRTRNRNSNGWTVIVTLPYPTIQAQYESTCPHCDETIHADDSIHNVDGSWVCYQCGHDAAAIEGTLPHA
jgi:hypothetical protein